MAARRRAWDGGLERLKDLAKPVGVIAGLVVAAIVAYFVWKSYGEIMPGLRFRVELANYSGSDYYRKEAMSTMRKEIAKGGRAAYEGKVNKDSSWELVATLRQAGTIPFEFREISGGGRDKVMAYPTFELTLELRDSQGKTLGKTQRTFGGTPDIMFSKSVRMEEGESIEKAIAAEAWVRAASGVSGPDFPQPDGNSR